MDADLVVGKSVLIPRLVSLVQTALSEMVCKKYPKAEVWSKKRQSVSFSFPEPHPVEEIEFRQVKDLPNNPIALSYGKSLDYKLTIYVPFVVHKIGENRYLAVEI